MRVAVTGATGFVGRHVVTELERRGISATLLCHTQVEASTMAARHHVVTVDLDAPPEDVVHLAGEPDVLIHLAWGGLPHYRSLHHFEHELPTQYQFLKSLLAGGLTNLVVSGTCLEYGLQTGALGEELEARPITPYGYAKNALRIQLEYLRQAMPFNLTWARLFYLYGQGQSATSLYSLLQAAAKRGDPSFDMSGGEQLRDYLPVSDAARVLVSLALTGKGNGIVNVCSGQPIAIRNLVEGWLTENGWSLKLNLGRYPYPDYEPMAFWGDRTKMDRSLAPQGDT